MCLIYIQLAQKLFAFFVDKILTLRLSKKIIHWALNYGKKHFHKSLQALPLK